MTDSDKISKAVTSITANHPLYKDIWICDESWVRIVNMHFKDMKDIKNMRDIIKRRLNRVAGAFDEFNVQNIYMTKFQTNCPYETNKRRPVSYYYYFGTGREGFTQGCPFSPLFAGLVLTNILEKINNELLQRASNRLNKNNKGDDEKGGQPLIMAYVDDTNCLIPLQDVLFFLKRFEHYGIPLGAIMNTDKTRIMTSTSGESILSKLTNNNEHTLEQELREAISKYSTNNSEMHEEVNGLRVLGSPIGSIAFQQQFIKDYFTQAKTDATNLLNGLDDDQTILQLYRQCTSHRLNHLFPSDVHAYANSSQCQPENWHKWDSPTARAFDLLNEEVILAITQKEKLQPHLIYLTKSRIYDIPFSTITKWFLTIG